MKRILFLLLLTVSVYGQNPSRFAKIQITGNSNSATATKVNVQEANGEVNTQTINTGFNKNIGLGGSDVVGATTLLNQYSTTPVDWTATAFNSGQVVFYGGKQWIAKIATVAGDVPAVSSKWEEITFDALANKTTTVDQTIIDGSTNAVSGNAVFYGLALKSNIGHTHVASQITDLSKASVGLGNVDNTSDLSKPLSTATINALATKAPISSVHNPVTLGTANGLSLSTQQLSLGLASSGVTGALSGTDWNTFNGKFNTPTGLTTNYLPKWNGSGFGNSIASEVGSNIGVNAIPTDGVGTQNFEMINGSVLASRSLVPQLYISSNAVGQAFSATRKVDGFATQYVMQGFDGNHTWSTAISGLAGSSISWIARMTLNNRGALLINKTDDDLTNQLQVAGTISASPATTANQVPTWGQVQAAARSYKVYTAFLSQTGTNAPTATVLENTLGGTIVWSYASTGVYVANLTGAFTINKTIVFTSNAAYPVTPPHQFTGGVRSNSDYIQITSKNGSGTLTNDLISSMSLEIRVYN